MQKVLDIGTGTGISAIDFADQYPNAEVIGRDLSPIQPDWTWSSDTFDFIHMRYLIGAIADWGALFKEAFRCCKPGGFVESVEVNPTFFSDDETASDVMAVKTWNKLLFLLADGPRTPSLRQVCQFLRAKIENDLEVEHFLDYIRAFNIPDWDKQHAFYTPDVTLDLPPNENLPTLKGSEGIKAHYRSLFGGVIEKLVPIELIIEGDSIFFWMETNFLATKPGIAPGGFNVQEGDIVRVTVWAYYKIEGGLMKTIVTNQLAGDFIGKTMTLEEAIKDSQSRVKRPELLLEY
ncbi:mRNA 3 end-processing YTH1 [Fusarium globosum]|uniref:mRNA 3 end-processing YTH1 n=1 Tax=Fusarium globosum TaxID=78864 RepID=A0A8H5Y7B3_9HYPO|nr:mRNA 3 end-processing YTH1 [Fusarium globosum]